MQSKYPLLALIFINPTRGIRARVDFFFLKSGNILAGVIFIFGPFLLGGGVSV